MVAESIPIKELDIFSNAIKKRADALGISLVEFMWCISTFFLLSKFLISLTT